MFRYRAAISTDVGKHDCAELPNILDFKYKKKKKKLILKDI